MDRYDRDERNRGEFSGGYGDRSWRAHHDGDLTGPYARDTHRDFSDNYGREGGAFQRLSGFVRSFRGRGPKNYRRSDERIAEEIHEVLTEDHDIDATDIEVRVENAEVTLSGKVRTRWEKRAAEEVVAQCRGVHDVHNRLKVEGYDSVHIGKAST